MQDGEGGVLVRMTEDGQYVADAAHRLALALLESLIVSPSRRAALGRGARAKAERDLTEERLGNDLMELFHSAFQLGAS